LSLPNSHTKHRRHEHLEHTIGHEHASEFPKLAAPARRALANAGYDRLVQLATITEAELSHLHGMGPSAILVLRDALTECGLSFRDPAFAPDPKFVPDPRVDRYIDSLPAWQQSICREVRSLVHAADPGVTETIKRTNRPYFVLEGNICALLAAKDHVNVFLYDGAIIPDPEGIITAGHENKTARTVAIRQDEPIKAPALGSMFRAIIANNRAGGWRKLKRQG
jgi:hypothetical protein